jgi:nucleoside-diphosphate-sugar epimerase
MRSVVTGGAGFIGSHLIEALIARGDEVVCIEHPGAPRGWVEGLPIRWCPVGLDDTNAIRRLAIGADVVFHLAALTEAASPADLYRVNTEGTARVLEALERRVGPPPRFVYVSSLAAAGPCRNGENLGPETIPFPLSHYGNSKLLGEAVVHAHADSVPSTIVRFPSVYGPRERAVLKVFRLVRHGAAVTVGGWDREISMLYVRDAGQGRIGAATSEQAVGRTYCIAHPETVTWREFATVAGTAMGRRPVLISIPAFAARTIAVLSELGARLRKRAAILNRDRVRELSQLRWVCDPSMAIAEAGFNPGYPLDRGIPETAAWYRGVGWL